MSGVALMLAAICLNVTCGDMSVISELSVNETNSIRNSSTNLMVRQNSTQEKQGSDFACGDQYNLLLH